jgi:hypothetical protein
LASTVPNVVLLLLPEAIKLNVNENSLHRTTTAVCVCTAAGHLFCLDGGLVPDVLLLFFKIYDYIMNGLTKQ